MEQALKLIIAKSPAAMSQAIKALQAVNANSPVAHIRYDLVAETALTDPQAGFSAEERALIAESIGAAVGETRGFMLRVRLTDAERAVLQDMANEAGQTLSEYARRKIFGS